MKQQIHATASNPRLVKGRRVLKQGDYVSYPGTGKCYIVEINFVNNTLHLEHCRSGNSWDMIDFRDVGAHRVD